MKTVGLITEYNPFHNGHAYHLQKALAITGADTALCVMSGDFVQRGAPAVFSKYDRTRMALLAGVSAVFELPLFCACQSAEFFAEGAVSLLDRLGCVDSLCFGCETDDLSLLLYTADLLLSEPPAYRSALQDGLKQGLSFPLARKQAVGRLSKAAASLLESPNNILAVEYIKALKKRGSHIRPYPLKRKGDGYHAREVTDSLSSATAIRRLFSEGTPEALETAKKVLPAYVCPLITGQWESRGPVFTDDFSLLFKNRLLLLSPEALASYADVPPELASRIFRHRDEFVTLTQFMELLKTKELTYARISRALFHILLGMTQEELLSLRRADWHFYARLLGFQKTDAALLTAIKASASLPLLTNPAKADFLSPAGQKALSANMYATALYESVLTDKYGQPFQNEGRRKLLTL